MKITSWVKTLLIQTTSLIPITRVQSSLEKKSILEIHKLITDLTAWGTIIVHQPESI